MVVASAAEVSGGVALEVVAVVAVGEAAEVTGSDVTGRRGSVAVVTASEGVVFTVGL